MGFIFTGNSTKADRLFFTRQKEINKPFLSISSKYCSLIIQRSIATTRAYILIMTEEKRKGSAVLTTDYFLLVSANPVHRVASWFKLLMRAGLSQDSVMTEVRFLSCQSWHGLVSSGGKTGQTSGARRSNHLKARLAGTGLSKLLCTTNSTAFILMPYCMKQSQFRGTPPKFNS